MCYFVYTNYQRQGAVVNMTMSELKNAEKDCVSLGAQDSHSTWGGENCNDIPTRHRRTAGGQLHDPIHRCYQHLATTEHAGCVRVFGPEQTTR